MTSFNYGGKKARDVGLKYLLRYYRMGDDSLRVFFFVCLFVCFSLGVVIAVFLSIEEMDCLITITPVGMGKP